MFYMAEYKIFHDRYTLLRLLGRGSFAEVWLATDKKTNIDVALKIYAPATGLDDEGLNVFAREFAIVANVQHKNLLTALHYDTCDRKPYLVLPYCQNGSVQKRMGLFGESDIWKFLHDIASGLNFLHSMNPPVIHQDIKPDNVLQNDNGDYTLTDFGVSSHCKSVLRRSVSEAYASAGTMAYMAPERFGEHGNTPIMASDIYSLAATAFELLTGDAPFGNNGGLLQKKGADIPQLGEKYSKDLRKVLNQCLNADPWNRPTAAELEQYAAKGMNGEHFLLKGEKSFFKKFWPVICVLVCIASVIFVLKYKHDQAILQEQIAHQAEIERQKMISSITTHICKGDSLYKLGKYKTENYDAYLLSAREQYSLALASAKEGEGIQFEEYIEHTENQIASVDTCLFEAYNQLLEKANFFEDEPSYKSEFLKRAENISRIINVNPQ